MNGKSTYREQNYRPGTSRKWSSVTTFREQMTDYARGERLQQLRAGLEPRLSREKVAAEIGVSTKSLYEWENNNGAIKDKNAQALAKFYGVDKNTLVTRDAEGMPEWARRIEWKLDALLLHFEISAAEIEAARQAAQREDELASSAAG